MAETFYCEYDIPEELNLSNSVAVDTEAMGLRNYRDRLCLVQLSGGDGRCHFVHFPRPEFQRSPRLCKLLQDRAITKIFHYGRFDIALLSLSFGISVQNVYCTKIASRLVRTYTDRHGLKDLCKELLGIELSKKEQTSDWGNPVLGKEQLSYAAADVLYLHALKERLDILLKRENRDDLAQACFDFLPTRSRLDLLAGADFDVLSYNGC